MGLSKATIRFLAREHKRKPFGPSLLTLGRQNVLASGRDVRDILRTEGLPMFPEPESTDVRRAVGDEDADRGYIQDDEAFRMLGIRDVHSLDYSDFEGADIVTDLNRPVNAELRSRFDVIIDSGTSEHVFDVKQCLANIVSMLKVGGRILHFSPANNYMNHGFFQFSPTLFLDYYHANRFADLRCFIAEESRFLNYLRPLTFYTVPAGRDLPRMFSHSGLLVFFMAEKTNQSSADVVPLQNYYQSLFVSEAHSRSGAAGRPAQGFLSRARNRIPPSWKEFLFKYIMVFDHRNRWPLPFRLAVMNLLAFLDPGRKPWGLKIWGRLG